MNQKVTASNLTGTWFGLEAADEFCAETRILTRNL